MGDSMSRQVWLITGAGRGMGADFAKAAMAAGHAVVATGRDPERVSKALGDSPELMLFQQMDAGNACRRVGYLTASQFSREYARFFGSAPTKDTARLLAEGLVGGAAR
jgi:NAD(P)-dependent dehydrogenase (short-subunit alcohol dehydrogenase family)